MDRGKGVVRAANIVVINKARPGENYIDNLIRTFNQRVHRTGVLSEVKKKAYYEKPSAKRSRKKRAGILRARRKMLGSKR